jgi:hypothetical protein
MSEAPTLALLLEPAAGQRVAEVEALIKALPTNRRHGIHEMRKTARNECYQLSIAISLRRIADALNSEELLTALERVSRHE